TIVGRCISRNPPRLLVVDPVVDIAIAIVFAGGHMAAGREVDGRGVFHAANDQLNVIPSVPSAIHLLNGIDGQHYCRLVGQFGRFNMTEPLALALDPGYFRGSAGLAVIAGKPVEIVTDGST